MINLKFRRISLIIRKSVEILRRILENFQALILKKFHSTYRLRILINIFHLKNHINLTLEFD